MAKVLGPATFLTVTSRLDLVNINLHGKCYSNIPAGSRVIAIFVTMDG